jgi:hypothetical protein
MASAQLKSELTPFDVTYLVVGSIIGADIYAASAFGASLLGPFSLVVWVIGGVVTIIIALCFARASGFDSFAPSPSYHKENWGKRQEYHDVVKIRTQAAGARDTCTFISHAEHIYTRKGVAIDFLRTVSLGNGLLFLRGSAPY